MLQGEEGPSQEDNGNLIFNPFSQCGIYFILRQERISVLSVPTSSLPVGFLDMELLLL